jgi:hypothetical protein
MADQFCRIIMRKAFVSGPVDDLTVVTGYPVKFEPETPILRVILRPVIPDEPDSETEIGYSQNALEPLTLVFRNVKVELTKSAYILFRYIYDLYRTEGRIEFDFAELSEILTGDDCGKSKNAIETIVRRLAESLEKILPPFSLIFRQERLYIKKTSKLTEKSTSFLTLVHNCHLVTCPALSHPFTKMLFMQIELRDINSIQPYDRNPRINDNAIDAVAASLREFGFRQPIVVDTENIIIVGHARYKAACKLGLQKIPVHVATDLTAEQVRAYRIADNKTNELSEWDMDILPIEISELYETGYDVKLLAFGDKELTQLLNAGMGIGEGIVEADIVPEPPDEAITQRGDIWILGSHRLMCGDSADRNDIDKLMNGSTAQL